MTFYVLVYKPERKHKASLSIEQKKSLTFSTVLNKKFWAVTCNVWGKCTIKAHRSPLFHVLSKVGHGAEFFLTDFTGVREEPLMDASVPEKNHKDEIKMKTSRSFKHRPSKLHSGYFSDLPLVVSMAYNGTLGSNGGDHPMV